MLVVLVIVIYDFLIILLDLIVCRVGFILFIIFVLIVIYNEIIDKIFNMKLELKLLKVLYNFYEVGFMERFFCKKEWFVVVLNFIFRYIDDINCCGILKFVLFNFWVFVGVCYLWIYIINEK